MKVGRKRVDLVVDEETARHYVELKHWIGEQKGVRYEASWYFRDRTNGIVKDVEKLINVVRAPAQRWLLILVTATPIPEDWRGGVAAFNSKFTPNEVVSLTDPSDFAEDYFLGLLKVRQLRRPQATEESRTYPSA